MEDKITSNVMVIHKGPANLIPNGQKKKKRFSLFKTAMVMLRSRLGEKSKAKIPINVSKHHDNSNNSDENWKKLVGSMRPLHSQDNRSPQPMKAFSRPSTSSDDDFFGSSSSFSTSSWGTPSNYGSTNNLQELTGLGRMRQSESTNSLSSKMSDTMSRYASALNLHDLDMEEEVDADVDDEEQNDSVLEKYCEADDMIDSKADEFIAKFYDQMKSQ